MSPTKAQLLDYADRLGVEADDSMTKDEINEAIVAHQQAIAAEATPEAEGWWTQPGQAPPADG